MLVGGASLTATPQAFSLVHALEAAELAVWCFDRATMPSVAVVADAVASYHFENCDALIAIGGAVAMDVAKGTALMTGQRNPFSALASDPGGEGVPMDVSAVPPLLVLPATPAAAMSVGGAIWIADETGAARPVRHPALRPSEAVLADDVIAGVPDGVCNRSSALAALVAADAGCSDAAIGGLLEPSVPAGTMMRRGLDLASAIEGARGPRRRLALTSSVIGGLDFGQMMLTLVGEPRWLGEAQARLGDRPADRTELGGDLVRSARSACGSDDLTEVDRVLEALGFELPGTPRRRGRRGRVG
ncbi:hypothetical protein BAL199_22117 [alpha proteobacterium BAL199]|jgi:alcohol dehydrogenase class IV|nr:hypothetical protein BAL199_22117 [alpha proteobacterium BAL199]